MRARTHRAGGGPRRLAAPLVCWAVLAGLAPALQRREPPEEVPAVDPYSRGEPERLAALGYESFGPFGFGDDHDSDEVHRVLGEIPMLWVETAHFRLGSTLEPYTLAEDQQERDKIRGELRRLKDKLPRVRPRTRELDRWLLLHLWAQRLEELYQRFSELAGVTDEDFRLPRPCDGPDLGAGRYLGQEAKFTVLLLQKQSGLGRYAGHFLSQEGHPAQRWYHHRVGSMFFGVAADSMKGLYDSDSGLHCSVANGLGQNFVDGFCSYSFRSPEWLRHGLAHVLSRELDPRFNVYGGGINTYGQDEDGWDWEPRVRARVKHDYFPSFEDMFGWTDTGSMKDPDHMMCWSRVQFLLEDPAATRQFLIAMKAPLVQGADERAALLERQREALPASFGASLEELEAAWAKWVAKTYRRR